MLASDDRQTDRHVGFFHTSPGCSSLAVCVMKRSGIIPRRQPSAMPNEPLAYCWFVCLFFWNGGWEGISK